MSSIEGCHDAPGIPTVWPRLAAGMVSVIGRLEDRTPPPPARERYVMSGDESTSDRVKIELAAEVSSPERARRFVERALTSWKCMELIEATVLLANELVTNSVLHANTDIRVEITKLPTGVRVQVSDQDVAPVEPRSASVNAEGGRGLALVEGISDGWGVERWRGGKTVWFQIVE